MHMHMHKKLVPKKKIDPASREFVIYPTTGLLITMNFLAPYCTDSTTSSTEKRITRNLT